jgi:hypothetical protein
MMAIVIGYERMWERVEDGGKERNPKSAITIVFAGMLIVVLGVVVVEIDEEVGVRTATAKTVVIAEV